MRLVFKCAVCNKPVDEWSYFPDRERKGWTIKVACHGQKQTAFINEAKMVPIYRQYGDDATIHGVAFKQKGIANV